jgi:hypothetical protein
VKQAHGIWDRSSARHLDLLPTDELAIVSMQQKSNGIGQSLSRSRAVRVFVPGVSTHAGHALFGRNLL